MKRRIENFDRRVKKRRLAVRSRVLSYFTEEKKKKRARHEVFIITRLVTNILNDICKDVEKKLFPPNSRILRRKYDTAKHVELHILETLIEKKNVTFDKEAADEKKKIWGFNWSTTCVWTGKTTHLSVDHLFPIRGAYGNRKKVKTGWIHEGLRGSDSSWNTIMVYKTKNSGFKIFNHIISRPDAKTANDLRIFNEIKKTVILYIFSFINGGGCTDGRRNCCCCCCWKHQGGYRRRFWHWEGTS